MIFEQEPHLRCGSTQETRRDDRLSDVCVGAEHLCFTKRAKANGVQNARLLLTRTGMTFAYVWTVAPLKPSSVFCADYCGGSSVWFRQTSSLLWTATSTCQRHRQLRPKRCRAAYIVWFTVLCLLRLLWTAAPLPFYSQVCTWHAHLATALWRGQSEN